jgi:predicted rRNA methylase YqxC with S4 and FtsJ domains
MINLNKNMKNCYFCEEKNINISKAESQPAYKIVCSNCKEYFISDSLTLVTLNDFKKKAAIWYLTIKPGFQFTGENIDFIEQEYRRFLQSR